MIELFFVQEVQQPLKRGGVLGVVLLRLGFFQPDSL